MECFANGNVDGIWRMFDCQYQPATCCFQTKLAVLAASSAIVLWAVLTYLDAGLTAGEAATVAGAAIVEVTELNLAIDNCQRVWRLYDA